MTALLNAFVGCVLQAVAESKNNFLVYNPVSRDGRIDPEVSILSIPMLY